jgi:hypothetical protein
MYEEPFCDMDQYESMSFEIQTQAALGSHAMKHAWYLAFLWCTNEWWDSWIFGFLAGAGCVKIPRRLWTMDDPALMHFTSARQCIYCFCAARKEA